MRSHFGSITALVLSTLIACGGEELEPLTGAEGATTPPGASAGSCTADGSCPAGQRCLHSAVPGSERYCSPPCAAATANQDCGALATSKANISYAVGDAQNRWRTARLERGLFCAPGDLFGAGTKERYCGFLCPKNSAVVWDAKGEAEGCACLPNFKAKPGASTEVLECVVDPEVECSVFNPCNATNTEKHHCSKGDFRCAVNDQLEGRCVDWVTGEDLASCYGYKPSSNCDVQCYASCGGGEACVTICCNPI